MSLLDERKGKIEEAKSEEKALETPADADAELADEQLDDIAGGLHLYIPFSYSGEPEPKEEMRRPSVDTLIR